jgi:lysyl-tRNA synthetase class 2
MLDAVEPRIGRPRPTYLVDWPAPMAALSRLRPDDPSVAERFELYAGGLELANGFSELADPAEQRRRLRSEQDQRRRLGHAVPPVDEEFLAALARMPEAGGVAVGLDRLLMLLVGAESIADVLLFPGREFLP